MNDHTPAPASGRDAEGALAEHLASALEPYGMQDCAAIAAHAVIHWTQPGDECVDGWADEWDVRPLIERRLAQAWTDGWAERDDHDWNGLSITPADCDVSNPYATTTRA